MKRLAAAALLVSACWSWDLAEQICTDAGGACTKAPGGGAAGGAGGGGVAGGGGTGLGGGAGGVGGSSGGGTGGSNGGLLTFEDGGLSAVLDAELNVPQTLTLLNNSTDVLLALSLSTTSSDFALDSGCSVIGPSLRCAIVLFPLRLTRSASSQLSAAWSGGSDLLDVSGDIYARVQLSTAVAGSGTWQLADGGALDALGGGVCRDTCEARIFDTPAALQVQPAAGCYRTADLCTTHCPVTATQGAVTFDDTCIDVAFVTSQGVAGDFRGPDGGVDGPCVTAAGDAGLLFPDEFRADVLNGSSWQALAWLRPDGVFYEQASRNAVGVDERGAFRSGYAWRGNLTSCSGSMGSWTSTSGTADVIYANGADNDLADAGACSSPLPLVCLGNHFRGQLPALSVPDGGRVAFLTSGSFKSGDGGIAAADALCVHEANASTGQVKARANRFLALLAVDGGQPFTRFNLDAGPWYRTDGQPVLFSADAVTAPAFRMPLLTLADGGSSTAFAPKAVTGAFAPPFGSDCSSWTSGTGSSLQTAYGNPQLMGTDGYNFDLANCSSSMRLYCFEN
jgi:hypothetical protein